MICHFHEVLQQKTGVEIQGFAHVICLGEVPGCLFQSLYEHLVPGIAHLFEGRVKMLAEDCTQAVFSLRAHRAWLRLPWDLSWGPQQQGCRWVWPRVWWGLLCKQTCKPVKGMTSNGMGCRRHTWTGITWRIGRRHRLLYFLFRGLGLRIETRWRESRGEVLLTRQPILCFLCGVGEAGIIALELFAFHVVLIQFLCAQVFLQFLCVQVCLPLIMFFHCFFKSEF